MALKLSAIDKIETPLSFERIQSHKQLRDFASIYVALGGYSCIYEMYYRHIPPVLYQKKVPFEMVVGYLKGKPVVTGILVLHANVADIYYVMTMPWYRKKGYGSAMMQHLLNRAVDQGFHLATLQASEEGKNVYARLGFKPFCTFVEYT